MALSTAEIEEILSKYLDRAVLDPDRGYIDAEDVKNTFRELYRVTGDDFLRYIRESSSFGSYVRHVETPMDWAMLRAESGGGSLPVGVLAIIEVGVIDPQQKILAWTGNEWLDLAGIGALPQNISKLIISPTQPPGSTNLMWLDTSTGTVPYPLKAWDGTQWLEVTKKGDPGETLHPEGFVDWASLLPDPPLWTSGPNLGQPKELAVYTTIKDKHIWVYNPQNPSAAPGPAVPPSFDANGNLVTPAEPPTGWIDLGVVEGPPGPQGPPGSFRIWDQTEAYRSGDIVAYDVPNQGIHLFLAKVDLPVGANPPGQNTDWVKFAEPPQNRVFISTVAGETPITNPPGGTVIVGDLFINEADEKAWVYAVDPNNVGQYFWEELTQPGTHIHIKTQSGDNPQTAPILNPHEGDIYLNVTDDLAWVYAEISAGVFDWQILVGPVTGVVMTSAISGQDPSVIWPTNATPAVGDMVVNTTDLAGWVWTGNQWAQLSSIPRITEFSVSGQAPSGANPANPRTDDLAINTTDGVTWIYDGNVWVKIASLIHVTMVRATGVAPTPTVPANPSVGDMVVNTADGYVWVYTGTAWELTTFPPKVTEAQAAGETPAVPGTTTLPTPSRADLFINAHDGMTWVYDGTAWVAVANSARITVSSTAAETPQAPGTTTIPTPRSGDMFLNSTDELAWLYDGTQWRELSAERPAVTEITGSGETPASAVPGSPPGAQPWAHDYEVYFGTQAPVAQEARFDRATNTIKFHRLGASNIDTSANLNAVKVGSVIEVRGPGLASGNRDQIITMTVTSVAQAGDIWTFVGTTVIQGFVDFGAGGDYLDGSTCELYAMVPSITHGDGAKRDDVIVNTTDQKTWIFDGTTWIIISEPPDKARGTVTYITDVTPTAPFDAANNWGFGAGTVEPDPTVVEPEPGDVWINHVLAEVGVFN